MDAAASGGEDALGPASRPTRKPKVYQPDPASVRAAARGDLEAFEELVRAYQAPLWRFLRHLTSDPGLAEDLTQETFLRVYVRLPSFRFRSRFSTWLFQIAHNLAVDALRSRARHERLLGRLRVVAPDPGPELAAELHAALGALPAKLRASLVLVEVMGFTCREAGQVLGVPEGTVKSRLFYARHRLVTWFNPPEERAGEV